MRKTKGITLIELMITMAVVGILAAVAYPSYQRYLVKSRRADAESALLELASFMERTYTVNGCYNNKGDDGLCGSNDDTLPNLPFISLLANGGRDTQAFPANLTYSITLEVNFDGGTYTLTATPDVNSSQAKDGILRLDQLGRKYWDKNNNGDITEDGENSW